MSNPLLDQVLTWTVSNATSIGAVLAWITKPLRDRLKDHEERIKSLERQLKAVPEDLADRLQEVSVNETRCQDAREEMRGKLNDLVEQFRDLQADFNACVSNEEFKAYSTMANAKIEKIMETLGYIRGRVLSGRPPE